VERAAELFAERGVTATSLDEVLAAAGGRPLLPERAPAVSRCGARRGSDPHPEHFAADAVRFAGRVLLLRPRL
jgi:hypothetical protein